MNSDWRSVIKISEEYEHYWEAFLDIMVPLHTMCDGRLGTINIATHRMESTLPYICLIHSDPYRAKPKARESEKETQSKG